MAHLLREEHTVIIDIEEVETEKSVAGDDAGMFKQEEMALV